MDERVKIRQDDLRVAPFNTLPNALNSYTVRSPHVNGSGGIRAGILFWRNDRHAHDITSLKASMTRSSSPCDHRSVGSPFHSTLSLRASHAATMSSSPSSNRTSTDPRILRAHLRGMLQHHTRVLNGQIRDATFALSDLEEEFGYVFNSPSDDTYSSVAISQLDRTLRDAIRMFSILEDHLRRYELITRSIRGEMDDMVRGSSLDWRLPLGNNSRANIQVGDHKENRRPRRET